MNPDRDILALGNYKLSSRKRKRSSNKSKCSFSQIGCKHIITDPYDYDIHQKDLSTIILHSQLLLETLTNIQEEMKEERLRSFRIEKMLTNFPAHFNKNILKKRLNKKISVKKSSNSHKVINSNRIISLSNRTVPIQSTIYSKPCNIVSKQSQIIPKENHSVMKTIPLIPPDTNINLDQRSHSHSLPNLPKVISKPNTTMEISSIDRNDNNNNNANKEIQSLSLTELVFEKNYYLTIFNNPIDTNTNSEWKIVLSEVKEKFAFGACIVPSTFDQKFYYIPLQNIIFPSFLILSEGKYKNCNYQLQNDILKHNMKYKQGDIISLRYNKNLQQITVFFSDGKVFLMAVYCNTNPSTHRIVPCVITTNRSDQIQLCDFNNNPKPNLIEYSDLVSDELMNCIY